jgi:hypothetical protein
VVGTRFGVGDAELRVWLDGGHDEVARWTGSIGYDPGLTGASLGYSSGENAGRRPNAAFELYIGPYRDRMDSKQVFFFDRIAYGPSRASVE